MEISHDAYPPAPLIRNRQHPERGGDTIEFILTLLVVILIGGGLLALAGTLNGEVGKTGKTILNWSGSISSIPAGGSIGDNNPDVHTPDPVNGTAFAVYSETDHSLDFYKRKAVPEVGTTFEGKVVTEVYTGFETDTYRFIGGDWHNFRITSPWDGIRGQVETVLVVDNGIHPLMTNFWFYNFTTLQTVNLTKLDLSQTTQADAMFLLSSVRKVEISPFSSKLTILSDFISCCTKLESIDLSASDLSSVTGIYHFAMGSGLLRQVSFPTDSKKQPTAIDSTNCMFADCANLVSVTGFPGTYCLNASDVDSTSMFARCPNLKLDCSSWDVTNVTMHNRFAADSPGVIEPMWSD